MMASRGTNISTLFLIEINESMEFTETIGSVSLKAIPDRMVVEEITPKKILQEIKPREIILQEI